MNNGVYHFYTGRLLGFRCQQCGDSFPAMWGNVCNGCRKKNQQHDDLLAEVKKLREALESKPSEI